MSHQKNYLITGATGFVGTHILERFKNKKNIKIFYIYRKEDLAIKKSNIIGIKSDITSLNTFKKLKNAPKNIDTIIHCANLAHSKYPEEIIKKINYFATVNLAKLAKSLKVKNFIFLSTAKINMNYDRIINNENDISKNLKEDFYTYTKYKTEKKVVNILKNSKVNYIILRPALVYGKNVKGNLEKLKLLTKIFLPMPFLNATEKKSFCSVNNLITSIELILDKKIKNSIFLVCDDSYYSFKDLIVKIFKNEKKKLILFPIKLYLFKFFFKLINKKDIYDSMFSSMILDNSKIKKKLNIKFNYNLENTNY